MMKVVCAVLLVCAVSALPALKSPKATVEITVSNNKESPIIIEVNGQDAPITAANFIKNVENHMYDDTVFHRVVNDFVVQGGDPTITHNPENRHSAQVHSIPLEVRDMEEHSMHYRSALSSGHKPVLSHEYGAVAMARTDDPNSASSQFYFVTGPAQNVQHLNGGYAVFGKVIQGMDTVKTITPNDFITSIKVVDANKLEFESRDV